MLIINRIARSIREGSILDALFDRAIAIPHTALVSVLSDRYIIEQNGVKADLSETNLRPLVKYRLKKGRLKHEATEVEYINKYIRPEYDVIDLGAGIGFTSCTAAKQLGDECTTIAVEANPNLKSAIERNANLNSVSIIPMIAAYAPQDESVLFATESDYRSASIYQNSAEAKEVKATNLADLVNEYDLSEFQLISDIEGSEAELIREIDLLKDCCRLLIMEVHKEKNPKVSKLIKQLEENEFNQVESKGRVKVYRNTRF